MRRKPRIFYIDWWNIKKSTVWSGLVFLVFLSMLVGVVMLWRNGYFQPKAGDAAFPKDTARIVSFEGDVRIVRAATRETILVTRTTYLAAGDTIQTQTDARAQVQMIDGSLLSVKPNSTVVIRDSASVFGGTNVRVTLDEGQLNVRTRDRMENSENVVEMQETENKIAAQTDASFKINPDAGGEIRISRGGVETSGASEKVLIKEGEFAAVGSGKVSTREQILAPPNLVSPPVSEQITALTELSFRWQKPDASSAVSYNLQVARSQTFAPDALVAERARLTGQILNIPSFAPGVYYWRVQALTASGQQSEWSEPRKFTIVRQTNSEMILAGEWQVELVGGKIYRITGRTEPGTVVRAAGRETFATSDGAFLLQIASAAPNVRVELNDDKGNRSRYTLSLTTGNAARQN